MRPLQSILLVAIALGSPQLVLGQAIPRGDDRVQVFIGVTDLNDQTGELQNGNDDPVDIDFDNLPTIGLEVETPFTSPEQQIEYGVNAGGGISWKGDGTRFAGTAGGSGLNVAFRIDNSFTLAELHLGGYVRAHISDLMDVYVGAGPAVIFGSHDVDDEEVEDALASNGTIILTSQDSSDIILGYYARAGIEFEIDNRAQWGLGVRYLGGEMEFDDTVGKFDIDGVQVLLTYSAWF
jgi:hypothetical protein